MAEKGRVAVAMVVEVTKVVIVVVDAKTEMEVVVTLNASQTRIVVISKAEGTSIRTVLLVKRKPALLSAIKAINKQKESGTEIDNSLEFYFVVPPPHS